MTEVGFALGKLIITADEVATVLELATFERHRLLGEKLRTALEGVGVMQRKNQGRALMEAALPAVADKIPVVLYFATIEDARRFAASIGAAPELTEVAVQIADE